MIFFRYLFTITVHNVYYLSFWKSYYFIFVFWTLERIVSHTECVENNDCSHPTYSPTLLHPSCSHQNSVLYANNVFRFWFMVFFFLFCLVICIEYCTSFFFFRTRSRHSKYVRYVCLCRHQIRILFLWSRCRRMCRCQFLVNSNQGQIVNDNLVLLSK